MFSKMSSAAYEALRETHPGLPSGRYVKAIIGRHSHQPGGVLRSDIRDMVEFIMWDSSLSIEQRRAACVGNVALDAMSIQEGVWYNAAQGRFAGLAEEGSLTDGPAPQQRFWQRATELAERCSEDFVADTPITTSSSSSGGGGGGGGSSGGGGGGGGGGAAYAVVLGEAAKVPAALVRTKIKIENET
jgi:uncharacterized membrane protein YgcG